MITDLVRELLDGDKINIYQYETYMLFGTNDLGVRYLHNMIDNLVLNCPLEGEKSAFYTGKLSEWRDIKTVINGVNNLLKGVNYDGSK